MPSFLCNFCLQSASTLTYQAVCSSPTVCFSTLKKNYFKVGRLLMSLFSFYSNAIHFFFFFFPLNHLHSYQILFRELVPLISSQLSLYNEFTIIYSQLREQLNCRDGNFNFNSITKEEYKTLKLPLHKNLILFVDFMYYNWQYFQEYPLLIKSLTLLIGTPNELIYPK